MKIVWQSSDFVLVDKDPLVLSVPPRFPDARKILGRELESFLGLTIFPVHRLDYEVSGAILFALHPKAHQAANREFEQRKVQKTYQALTSPNTQFVSGDKGLWRAKILKGKKRAYESPHGDLAETEFEVLGNTPDQKYFNWALRPRTGRSHQLRWEMHRHQVPICGDSLYGSTEAWSLGGIALRSLRLEFTPEFAQTWKLPAHLEVSGFQ